MEEKERLEVFEMGRLAGIREEHVRSLTSEVTELKSGQTIILEKIEEMNTKLEGLNNWRWFVMGISASIAFIISMASKLFIDQWRR